MTQRVFDVENEQDMKDLWDILPDDIEKICLEEANGYNKFCYKKVGACEHSFSSLRLIAIDWHNKTEIHRPIKEATEADIGKLCKFWNDFYANGNFYIGVLKVIDVRNGHRVFRNQTYSDYYKHCRRLTKQEIEELI